MDNFGYIYKITNLINNKCYIGQTIKNIEERWNRHKRDAFNKKNYNYNYPLYKAFRKYGLENFSFEIIEECNISELNEKEIYWIQYYDSYKNGYNQTTGGKGNRLLDLDEKEIIKCYEKEQNIITVSKIFNCSRHTINNILHKNNVKIKTAQEHAQEKGFIVYQLDDNKNIIKTFKTIVEAGQKMFDLNLTKTSRNLACKAIRSAILSENKCYGFFWDSPYYSQEQKYKFQLKNTKKLNNNSKNNNQKKEIKLNLIKKTKKYCNICGKEIYQRSSLCSNCEKLRRKKESILEKELKGITKDFLKQEIRNKSFTQIAKEQGVSDNTIRKWCKLYNLPSKSSEIKKYSDKDWNIF